MMSSENDVKLIECCLCGQMVIGFGNNPWPLSNDVNDRCCDICNSTKVIPARLAQMGGNKNGKC